MTAASRAIPPTTSSHNNAGGPSPASASSTMGTGVALGVGAAVGSAVGVAVGAGVGVGSGVGVGDGVDVAVGAGVGDGVGVAVGIGGDRRLRSWRCRGFRPWPLPSASDVGVDVGAGVGGGADAKLPVPGDSTFLFVLVPDDAGEDVLPLRGGDDHHVGESGVAKQVEANDLPLFCNLVVRQRRADEGEALRQRLHHLAEGAVVAGGDGDP